MSIIARRDPVLSTTAITREFARFEGVNVSMQIITHRFKAFNLRCIRPLHVSRLTLNPPGP